MLLKVAFLDIGELGWSLHLSAHMRWLKKNTDSMIAVVSFPDRRCLFVGLADEIIDVPESFYKKYDLSMQDTHKLRHVSWEEIREFLSSCVPEGYSVPGDKEYSHRIFSDDRIYMPYKYSRPPGDGKEILVFPRYRIGLWARRNLPEGFYSNLIKRLCDEFPNLTVRTIGTKSGTYNIKINRSNYVNWVGKGEGLQDMIDSCQSAVVAIGSQSALPKISLLQGVPTFMVGHQKSMHTQAHNWMNTKVGFYEIDKRGYAKINIDKCVEAGMVFIRGAQ